MKEGQCKLCLRTAVQLRKSHFMPARLYDYCRHLDLRPVRIAAGIVIPTDYQVQDYLLCNECEQLLNEGGESWVNPRLATFEKTFPLHDLLTKLPPAWQEDGNALYFAAQNPDIKVEKLAHFAMGLYWKASVHSWTRQRREPWIELGPYSEMIRKWLLSKGVFPAHVYLAFSEPYEGGRDVCRIFYVHLPGLTILMSIGKVAPEATKSLCFWRNSFHPMFVSDDLSVKVTREFARQFQGSRKTKALLESKARYERESGAGKVNHGE